jgi:ABC-2 type transport system ATP-binding protein
MKVDNTDKACAVIREQLGCSRMEILEDNQIKLFEMLDSPEIIVETLVKNGVKLYMINQMGSNLENYFIELVGGEYHA